VGSASRPRNGLGTLLRKPRGWLGGKDAAIDWAKPKPQRDTSLCAPQASGLAANGYGEHSPGGYTLASGLVIEIIMTFMFLFIILGSTDSRAPQGFAPIAIGLGLTLVHLISIPVTNTSVNPARSTGPALMVGGWALQQLWLFWVAPLVGAALAGIAYKFVGGSSEKS